MLYFKLVQVINFHSCDFLSRRGQIDICRYAPVCDTNVCTENQENQKALNSVIPSLMLCAGGGRCG